MFTPWAMTVGSAPERSAPAITVLRAPEVDETAGQGDDRPDDRDRPRVRQLVLRMLLEQRPPDDVDVRRDRVERQHLNHPTGRMGIRELRRQREEDAGRVQP